MEWYNKRIVIFILPKYFDNVDYLNFSSDSKSLAYGAEIDEKYYSKLFFNSKTYTGSICGGNVVYIKDGKIMLRD